MNEGRDVAVIGGGQAASELAWALRKKGFEGSIAILGRETYPPYDRPPLSKRWLAESDAPERLFLRGAEAYEQARIELRTRTEVKRIAPASRTIETADGLRIKFQTCVIATGARPRIPQIPGRHLVGVTPLRSIGDAASIRAHLKPETKIAILGGGYLGLEVAATAAQAGCLVTLIESAPHLLGRSLSSTASAMLQARHEREGVQFLFETRCVEIGGVDKVKSIVTSTGYRLKADMVVIAIGADPEIELAAEAGLICRNGIVVSPECRSSAQFIYAIGDCANQFHPRYGLHLRLESIQNALFHARSAAAAISGYPLPSPKPPTFWSNQYDLKIQLAGTVKPGIPCHDVLKSHADSSFTVERYQEDRLMAIEAINAPAQFLAQQKQLEQDTHPA